MTRGKRKQWRKNLREQLEASPVELWKAARKSLGQTKKGRPGWAALSFGRYAQTRRRRTASSVRPNAPKIKLTQADGSGVSAGEKPLPEPDTPPLTNGVRRDEPPDTGDDAGDDAGDDT
ncbi:MAG: hypothetical protein M3154_04975, partial [Candidatus Eremiobacteraeota bacterium]|nr:hypothetical protein [Candidatus Eremiobacteraeota bacterium]